jgi:hypothetical protein
MRETGVAAGQRSAIGFPRHDIDAMAMRIV